MKKKALLGVTLVLMAIGFAAVSSTLYINGTLNIESNLEDYDVYYSNAKVNGEVNKRVIVDDTHIAFTAKFKNLGETYTLEYDITNGSKNYDADVVMSCTAGNDYISVTNSWIDHTVINSTETKSGILKAEVIKAYTGDDELEINVICEIKASAQERTTQGTGTPADKVSTAKVWVAVTGDGTQVGDEIAVGDEHFYVISNDGTTLKALAKYNLLVGNEFDNESWVITPVASPTGIQSSTAKGYADEEIKRIGVVPFSNSSDPTWNAGEDGIEKKAIGTLHDALEAYKTTLPAGTEVRLITKAELDGLGCDSSSYSCLDAPEWVISTSYWSGSADADDGHNVWFILSFGYFGDYNFGNNTNYGVRPVIILEA